MKFITLFILSFICVFTSCEKEEDPVPVVRTDVLVTPALKEWGYFKKGSYWIYKDSIDNSIDSVYITSITVSTSTSTAHNIENITIRFNDPDYEYALCSYPYDRIERRGARNTIIFNPVYTATTSTYGYGINNNYNVDTLKNVAGNTYANLRCIYYSYQYASQSSTTYLWEVERAYWKKNVGRVKKCPFPSTPSTINYHAYELLRFSVLQ
ncbi:MAG: hypothetical protein SGJ15_08380 [Bacteroidota bacterium]|nr:hypothetical protein [Bacteroidota bacterium]